MAILEFFMSSDGFGKDIWTITPDKITQIVQVRLDISCTSELFGKRECSTLTTSSTLVYLVDRNLLHVCDWFHKDGPVAPLLQGFPSANL